MKWRQITRNHYVAELDDFVVAEVVRPQKHGPDGVPLNWRIVVLGNQCQVAESFPYGELPRAQVVAEHAALKQISRLWAATR